MKKYNVDPESKEYKQGYADFMGGRRTWYSRKVEYQKYKNWKAGYNNAKEHVLRLGKDATFSVWRTIVTMQAIGRPEKEARDILRLADGNVFRHEIDAVMLKLHSTSVAFNEGRDAYLNGRKETDSPYSRTIDYANDINWRTGYQTTELAVRLHGRNAVVETL